MLRAAGTTIFITPVNIADMQKKSSTAMGIEPRTKKANTIQWKIVSVGDGADVATGIGIIRVPVPFKVGDIVLLNTEDEHLREHWQMSNFLVGDVPCVWTVGWRPDSSSGDLLGIVED
jgi:co-chaperonin GroES (HSP10)